jgi:Ca2+-binding RTX toxin-like protein
MGSAHADNLYGNELANVIHGGAGNDLIDGGSGNDRIIGEAGDDKVTGGAGIDTVQFSGDRSQYVVSIEKTAVTIADKTVANDGTDLLSGIERLKFADKGLALDVDGNAGTVAKIIGAVFGKQAIENKVYVGIGLSFLDGNWSYDNLAALALDAAGAKNNDQVVTLLWTNVIGFAPSVDDKKPYIQMLENGMSVGALAKMAADSSFNTAGINLVGLALSGIEYTEL